MEYGYNGLMDSNITIRSASFRDVIPASQLDSLCFGADRWSVLDFIYLLGGRSSSISFAAETGGKLIAFASMERDGEDGKAWITTIATHPTYQNRGVGSALMERCESAANGMPLYLTVDMTNETALRFYEGRGYRRLGSIPRYYVSGHDAWVYAKPAGD